MKIISADNMREIDARTIAEGISGEILMERAGFGCVDEILEFVSYIGASHVKRYTLICGKGNNGGDGFVIARRLAELQDKPIQILFLAEENDYKNDAAKAMELLPKSIKKICTNEISKHLKKGDLIIDAIFGTGIQNEIKDPLKTVVSQINNSGLPVVSIDIPSGLNGNTGEVLGEAVFADMTIIIGMPKTGNFFLDAPKYSERLRFVDIGFPKTIIAEYAATGQAIFADDIRPNLKRRVFNSHKYCCGNILVVGGSKDYSGAPMLAGSAALHSGAGMVTIAVPAIKGLHYPRTEAAPVFQMIDTGNAPTLNKKSLVELKSSFEKKDVVVIGPGMIGVNAELPVLEAVLKTDKTVILDAGALLLASKYSDLLKRKADIIMTPHTGEIKKMAENLGLKKTEMTADEYASWISNEFSLYTILKGQHTRIYTPNGKCFINTTGNCGLASAGTGDVLAGMLGAFIAGLGSEKGIKTAVFIHGLTAELPGSSKRSLTADTIIKKINSALQYLSPFV